MRHEIYTSRDFEHSHLRKTYSQEIDPTLYFQLKRIFKDSLAESGTELVDGYILRSTSTPDATNGTLYAQSNNLPILTTAAVKQDSGEIWRNLHESHLSLVGSLATRVDQPIQTPYIADRLEMGSVFYLDAIAWTGDFSRCFGWIVLAPNQIRP